MSKPRVRIPARSAPVGNLTADSFQNLAARTGLTTPNLNSFSTYGLNPVTRTRVQLEFGYRGSWVFRAACDIIPDDMTREGIVINSQMEPKDQERLRNAQTELGLWASIAETESLARLYGGAIGVMMIDGQDVSTPLRVESIAQGSFRGIVPLDRWQVPVAANNYGGAMVSEMGPSFGLPEYYTVAPTARAFSGQRIHYSRVLRREGDPLPYWQRIAENGWGASVMEALWDRLIAFDSTTNGAAQLAYRSYLRVLRLKGLRTAVASAGGNFEGIAAQLNFMRGAQSNEGLTVIDSEDEMQFNAYTFAGVGDMLLQIGQQLSGALQIPLVRLFGQSPAGLNSTGDGDLKTYYDGIRKRQNKLRPFVHRMMTVLHMSELGRMPDDDFLYDFASLYDTSLTEKTDIASKRVGALGDAVDKLGLSRATALRDLRAGTREMGMFGQISDDDIEKAEELDEAPPVVPPTTEEDDPADPARGDGDELDDEGKPKRRIELVA